MWALGDVNGGPQFTHASLDDFRIVHANITGGNRTTADRMMPYTLFTDPELGRVGLTEEEVHFIAPKPEDLPMLMDAYLEASRRILNSKMHPVVAAAVIAYLFVFLHPFSDGNGRVHRFLIHYALSFRRFAPDGVVFPISATMLHRQRDYDASLESFSKPLLPLVEYKLDGHGRMTVLNDTRDFYRHVDCTFIAEMLFSFVEETIEKELPAEIQFLQQYDTARASMRDIVDLPNRHADLFVRLCLQNKPLFSFHKVGLFFYH